MLPPRIFNRKNSNEGTEICGHINVFWGYDTVYFGKWIPPVRMRIMADKLAL
jgi:hypothetical protein